MKTIKIVIKNLFGITALELDGRSIEITGTNGSGKTSAIDAIKYALTNNSERDYIVRQGETEGEIIIETDTGLSINRKKRTTQADYKSIKEDGKDIAKPESFLQTIFTPMQLDPVAFTQMGKDEQNRIILDLIEFTWDLNWIREQFGELPEVNYQQNILQVLNEIQSDNGKYYKDRQLINSELLHGGKTVTDIAKTIPANYEAAKWEQYQTAPKYDELSKIKLENGKIERAKLFKESYDNKIRGYQAELEIAVSAEEKKISTEKQDLTNTIERLKAEIVSAQDKLKTLDSKLADKKALAQATYNEQVAILEGDIQVANKYIGKIPADTTVLQDEINMAEAMKLHLNEYRRMNEQQKRNEDLKAQSDELTRKIELARKLPGQILKTATIPVEGLTVENGIPLINGLPISNLSEGEKLDLCVDVTISKTNTLQIILIDGTEKLSDDNRAKLYSKCKSKGLQFIAARTTNGDTLEVTEL